MYIFTSEYCCTVEEPAINSYRHCKEIKTMSLLTTIYRYKITYDLDGYLSETPDF